MIRIFDITLKDLTQLIRDRRIFIFLLVMPVLFTLLFGFAFGAFNSDIADERLPVGFLDLDDSQLSHSLRDLLTQSEVIQLRPWSSPDGLEKAVTDGKLAAAIIVPAGYGRAVVYGKSARLTLIADTSTTTGMSVESEALTGAIRLENAARAGTIMEEASNGDTSFKYTYKKVLEGWQNPPIQVVETTSSAIRDLDERQQSISHTAPGMMLQFSIASLMTSAQIIVNERKSRVLKRLFTTAARRIHILVGHYLSMLILLCCQFFLLISFGQLILHISYLNAPTATALVAFCAASGIAGLGLLVGTVAKNDEQATLITLVLMFLLTGIGGAWVPLEVTGPTFQAIGHISPLAWAMDGFKNITIRGLGISAVMIPCTALVGYAVLFFALAAWRLSTAEE